MTDIPGQKKEGGLRTKGKTGRRVKGQPLISVVTVVYNGQECLEKTLLSVVRQTYENLEYVIVDGGSEDETVKILEQYADVIDHWISEKDAGIYDAMNKAFAISTGEYLTFLNCGDEYATTTAIERILDNPPPRRELIYCDVAIQDASGAFIKNLKAKPFTTLNLVVFGTRTVCHQAIFLRREQFVQYDTRYKLKAELNWYFDLAERIPRAQIYHCPIVGVKYRLGGYGDVNYYENQKDKFRLLMRRFRLAGIVLALPVSAYGWMRQLLKLK